MITIGVTQIKNSTSFEENFNSIAASLDVFSKTDVDLVLFPECSLSGFSASIKECTIEAIQSYLEKIEAWTKENNKAVVLPTALMKDSSIFNTGFLFDEEGTQQFYKLGLTDSEKKFFSIPNEQKQKVFKVKGVSLAILICFEAQMDPWEYFNDGEVDVVLWPGYWGWKEGDTWQKFKTEGEPNLIFQNMNAWKRPLIQANFAFNDLSDLRDSGPHGLSMFINSDNTLHSNAEFDKESCYRIRIENNEIINSSKIADL